MPSIHLFCPLTVFLKNMCNIFQNFLVNLDSTVFFFLNGWPGHLNLSLHLRAALWGSPLISHKKSFSMWSFSFSSNLSHSPHVPLPFYYHAQTFSRYSFLGNLKKVLTSLINCAMPPFSLANASSARSTIYVAVPVMWPHQISVMPTKLYMWS